MFDGDLACVEGRSHETPIAPSRPAGTPAVNGRLAKRAESAFRRNGHRFVGMRGETRARDADLMPSGRMRLYTTKKSAWVSATLVSMVANWTAATDPLPSTS